MWQVARSGFVDIVERQEYQYMLVNVEELALVEDP